MKNFFSGSSIALGLLLATAACHKYVAFIPPAESPDNTPVAQKFLSNVPSPVDSTKSDITETDTINLPDSVILILPKLCVSRKGTNEPCNGVVDVHLRLLTSKKDILLFGKPTVSAAQLLATGGQAMLTILFNGDTTQLLEGQNFILKIPVKRTLTDYRQMLFFTENSTDIWAHKGLLAESTREYYSIRSNQLDTWLSPAYVDTASNSTVAIALKAAGSGPDVSKARLFIVPENIHSVVPATYIKGLYASASTLPLNQEATLLAIAKEGENLWLGRQKVSLQSRLDVAMEFKLITPKELDEALSDL